MNAPAGEPTLLQRLRERKLVQWAVAYLAGAWVVLQALDLVGQQFGWPPGLLRGVTLTLAIGFLIALVLAWYHGERGLQRVTGVELMILALLLAIGGGMLWHFGRSAAPAAAPRPPYRQRHLQSPMTHPQNPSRCFPSKISAATRKTPTSSPACRT